MAAQGRGQVQPRNALLSVFQLGPSRSVSVSGQQTSALRVQWRPSAHKHPDPSDPYQASNASVDEYAKLARKTGRSDDGTEKAAYFTLPTGPYRSLPDSVGEPASRDADEDSVAVLAHKRKLNSERQCRFRKKRKEEYDRPSRWPSPPNARGSPRWIATTAAPRARGASGSATDTDASPPPPDGIIS
eukprot:CAMPEP_0174929468 /NCGR_PEP_ID=MMETSP1355-20121228/27219_1 /TAXON_ID=464990 /ORGANISM="Hemiselmis tepida, Strain CCMP443" /LENGTH=186 /DNA_ID=CAMNT_0016175673 /DNA_START=44 /DNA_END=601 /DNA_ORIENTATION=-